MRPAYLLLDEPTAGLDPAGVEALLASLTSLEERGTTIALSTHDLAFAWEWADDLALLHDGHLRQDAAHRVLSDEPALHAAALRAPWQAATPAAKVMALADVPLEVGYRVRSTRSTTL